MSFHLLSRRLLPRLTAVRRHPQQWDNQTQQIAASSNTNVIIRRYYEVPLEDREKIPSLATDPVMLQDYAIVMPEQFGEKTDTEALRVPKRNDPPLDFNKVNLETAFKALSSNLVDLNYFILDFEHDFKPPKEVELEDLFRKMERAMVPVDVTYNLMYLLIFLGKEPVYQHPEVQQTFQRYHQTRKKFADGHFGECFRFYAENDQEKLSGSDRRLLKHHYYVGPMKRELGKLTLKQFDSYQNFMQGSALSYAERAAAAELTFSHTVDDPDLLALISADFDHYKVEHHADRTPLTVDRTNLHHFMRLCPDRFLREMLWSSWKKLCSKKSPPNLNNMDLSTDISLWKRQIAELRGFRNHLDLKLHLAMAESAKQVFDSLECMRIENAPKLETRLDELKDYAFSNSNIESFGKTGFQTYDCDYWANRYSHEIIIGRPAIELRSFFPLSRVLHGLRCYLNNYLGIEVQIKPVEESQFWPEGTYQCEVSRKNQFVGTIFYDPYLRSGKTDCRRVVNLRVIPRWQEIDSLPVRYFSTPFKMDRSKGEAQLSPPEVINLFSAFTDAVQPLLYNYKYYQLNIYGCLEPEAEELLANLSRAHLLQDHRILQSCSTRGDSKQLDQGLIEKIMRGYNYFRPLQTWHDLYLAHFDAELHSTGTNAEATAKKAYSIYSPFERDAHDYDYCNMTFIFGELRGGVQYARLWSRLLANFCVEASLKQCSSPGNVVLSTAKVDELRKFNSKLIDELFHPEFTDSHEKLESLTGERFKPLDTRLGEL